MNLEILLAVRIASRGHELGRAFGWRFDWIKIRAVNWEIEQAGAAIDLPLATKQKRNAASRFLRKATGHHGAARKITIELARLRGLIPWPYD